MRIFASIPDYIKGIFLIIAGAIIFFDSLGYVPQLFHSIVLFGSIAMIIIGLFMANVHRKVIQLISKGNKKQDNNKDETPPSGW